MIDKFLSLLTDSLFILLGFGPDVVTVTSGTAGNAGSTAAELITYMSARLLEVAEFNTILDQFGKPTYCQTKIHSDIPGKPKYLISLLPLSKSNSTWKN